MLRGLLVAFALAGQNNWEEPYPSEDDPKPKIEFPAEHWVLVWQDPDGTIYFTETYRALYFYFSRNQFMCGVGGDSCEDPETGRWMSVVEQIRPCYYEFDAFSCCWRKQVNYNASFVKAISVTRMAGIVPTLPDAVTVP